MKKLLITGYGLYTLQSQWPIAYGKDLLILLAATRRLYGVVWSCSEFLGATLSLPVAPPTGTYSYLLGAARSYSELLGPTLSLPVAPPIGTYSHLLGAARSYSEFIGVPRSNSVVARCSPLVTGTYSYLLGAARSCSELLGATLSLQVASPTHICSQQLAELLGSKVPQ